MKPIKIILRDYSYSNIKKNTENILATLRKKLHYLSFAYSDIEFKPYQESRSWSRFIKIQRFPYKSSDIKVLDIIIKAKNQYLTKKDGLGTRMEVL